MRRIFYVYTHASSRTRGLPKRIPDRDQSKIKLNPTVIHCRKVEKGPLGLQMRFVERGRRIAYDRKMEYIMHGVGNAALQRRTVAVGGSVVRERDAVSN